MPKELDIMKLLPADVITANFYNDDKHEITKVVLSMHSVGIDEDWLLEIEPVLGTNLKTTATK